MRVLIRMAASRDGNKIQQGGFLTQPDPNGWVRGGFGFYNKNPERIWVRFGFA